MQFFFQHKKNVERMKTICNKNEDTRNQNKAKKEKKIHGQMMWADANEYQ